jgi:hypothetical protein
VNTTVLWSRGGRWIPEFFASGIGRVLSFPTFREGRVMEQPKRETTFHALGALRLLGSLGLVMSGAVLLGLAGGAWAGRALGSGWPLVVGVLAGVAGGGLGVYRLLLRELPWKR